MKLLTAALRKKFPKLGTTSERDPKDIPIIAKFFTPDSFWTWYATEFDEEDEFWGYVKGLEKEFGYFSLAELQSVRGPFGLRIERDLYFGEHTLQEVLDGTVS